MEDPQWCVFLGLWAVLGCLLSGVAYLERRFCKRTHQLPILISFRLCLMQFAVLSFAFFYAVGFHLGWIVIVYTCCSSLASDFKSEKRYFEIFNSTRNSK